MSEVRNIGKTTCCKAFLIQNFPYFAVRDFYISKIEFVSEIGIGADLPVRFISPEKF